MAAGGTFGETPDNPVGINVTAMVDVLLCLCMFYMCVLSFRWPVAKMETWLPKDCHWHGCGYILEEIRVFVKWEPSTGRVVRKVSNRGPVADDGELMGVIRKIRQDYLKAGQSDSPVIIDATEKVPWQEVVHVIDLCRRLGIHRVEFAAPIDYSAPHPPAAGFGK